MYYLLVSYQYLYPHKCKCIIFVIGLIKLFDFVYISPKRGRETDKTPVTGIGKVIVQVMENTTYADLKKLGTKYVDNSESVIIIDEYKV